MSEHQEFPQEAGPDRPHGDEVIGAGAGNSTEKDPDLPADLTKAEVSRHIDRLQEQTGRGS